MLSVRKLWMSFTKPWSTLGPLAMSVWFYLLAMAHLQRMAAGHSAPVATKEFAGKVVTNTALEPQVDSTFLRCSD